MANIKSLVLPICCKNNNLLLCSWTVGKHWQDTRMSDTKMLVVDKGEKADHEYK
jgi:hypothetical protein